MDPRSQSNRDRQFATLGDIKMLAENIGRSEADHRNLVGNINEIISWIKGVDQAAFISIHLQVNGSIEFTEETTKLTLDFITKGREALVNYEATQETKAKAEAIDAMGDEFEFNNAKYSKKVITFAQTTDHPAGSTVEYYANGQQIPVDHYEKIVQMAYVQKKDQEEFAKIKEVEDTKAKQVTENEPAQAPAEPQSPVNPAEVKDGSSSKKSK